MIKNNYFRLSSRDLEKLFNYFLDEQYSNIGPYFKDGAIMYGELDHFEDLPKGYYEKIDAGKYNLVQKSDKSLFQYTHGPQSFKAHFFPQRSKLWSAEINEGNLAIKEEKLKKRKKVFWGIRSCDLYAISTLDRVFLNRDYKNPNYEVLRKETMIIAVNCGQPSNTCFCTSMDTGPKVKKDFDLAITEVLSKKKHHFIAETGSQEAQQILTDLSFQFASEKDIEEAEKVINKTSKSMDKAFDRDKARKFLIEKADDKHWQDVEKRCLACANCTLVCPTCFCTTTEDITDLEGKHTERWQKWDSCFNGDYSYIHGGIVRKSIKSRYRQWISHKLSSWYDQFDMSGCVGCGRCITWCPVGIDIRQEVKELLVEKDG
ncbi:MAG: 4Fe-4S dicluster domain-containing protein [Cytophagales bacterium]